MGVDAGDEVGFFLVVCVLLLVGLGTDVVLCGFFFLQCGFDQGCHRSSGPTIVCDVGATTRVGQCANGEHGGAFG